MQFLIFRPAHLHRRSAVAVVAPMALARVEAFSNAAAVTDKNVGLLFL